MEKSGLKKLLDPYKKKIINAMNKLLSDKIIIGQKIWRDFKKEAVKKGYKESEHFVSFNS